MSFKSFTNRRLKGRSRWHCRMIGTAREERVAPPNDQVGWPDLQESATRGICPHFGLEAFMRTMENLAGDRFQRFWFQLSQSWSVAFAFATFCMASKAKPPQAPVDVWVPLLGVLFWFADGAVCIGFRIAAPCYVAMTSCKGQKWTLKEAPRQTKVTRPQMMKMTMGEMARKAWKTANPKGRLSCQFMPRSKHNFVAEVVLMTAGMMIDNALLDLQYHPPGALLAMPAWFLMLND